MFRTYCQVHKEFELHTIDNGKSLNSLKRKDSRCVKSVRQCVSGYVLKHGTDKAHQTVVNKLFTLCFKDCSACLPENNAAGTVYESTTDSTPHPEPKLQPTHTKINYKYTD